MYFIVLVNLFLLSCPKNHSKKLWYIEAAVFKQNLRFQPAPVYRLPVYSGPCGEIIRKHLY